MNIDRLSKMSDYELSLYASNLDKTWRYIVVPSFILAFVILGISLLCIYYEYKLYINYIISASFVFPLIGQIIYNKVKEQEWKIW